MPIFVPVVPKSVPDPDITQYQLAIFELISDRVQKPFSVEELSNIGCQEMILMRIDSSRGGQNSHARGPRFKSWCVHHPFLPLAQEFFRFSETRGS